ncbi:MAG: flagellar biosynthetic protein FliR [Peptococcaceae bacterium]|jgi:flagellar biosynthetic protein FliR|nr:flagellar biosynthetic protein FliR [Peptococcaceae bacterium]
MDISAPLLEDIGRFFLLIARFAGIGFIPVFSTRNVPVQWRVAFILTLTLLSWQSGLAGGYAGAVFNLAYYGSLFLELVLGLSLALVVHFIFAGIQLSGQYLDTQMGFGITNVLDPMMGTAMPLLGNFQYILCMFVFLEIDGHIQLLEAMRASYEFIPLGGVDWIQIETLTRYFSDLFGGIFLTGFKLAAPIMTTLMISDVVLGFMNRMVPQLHVFMVSMPVKISLGMVFLWMLIPFYIIILNKLLVQMLDQIMRVIQVLA